MASSFKIMGSGAGPGAPSFFCDCPGCREARENPTLSRTRSGALITTRAGNLLIDAPPDLRAQLVRERVTRIDNVMLTHWHYDHFGGLGELEYYVKLDRKEPIPLFLPPSAREQFLTAFPNLREVFRVIPWAFMMEYRFGDLAITPLPAAHGVETAGFLVNSFSSSVAYFPDTAGLPKTTAIAVEGVEWLVCDATFYGENWYPDTHMSVAEAIDLGREVKARHTVLTHLSVHYSQPVTGRELEAAVAAHKDVLVAYDGMEIKL